MIGRSNYSNRKMVLDRLIKEKEEHGSIVIALDFDNTIYDYHNIGMNFSNVIDPIKRAMELGDKVFIFTANNDHNLVKRVTKEVFGVELPINEGPLDHLFGGRKPFYSILIDDRAGLDSTLRTLNELNTWNRNKL